MAETDNEKAKPSPGKPADPEPKKVAKEASIGDELSLYVAHLRSLSDSLPSVLSSLRAAQDGSRGELTTFETSYCKVDVEGDTRKITVSSERFRAWRWLFDRLQHAALANHLVPRSIFVALVSQYDAFLGRLLRAIFLRRPELLNVSEKEVSVSQLLAFGSLDEAREFIIEKEVEGFLRSSHSDQFKWMEGRFSVPLRTGLEIWPQFIELTERRNLYVHTDGMVSRQYLSVCKDHKCKHDAVVAEGAYLAVSEEYFRASYRCLFELGFKLSHVLWRKLLPDERERADADFIAGTYELIEREEYVLACALLDFAGESFKKFSSEWQELVMTVNRAQAHKWRGEPGLATKIMGDVDWSAKGYEFKLANAALAEKWDECYAVMKHIGKKGPVQKSQYRDWPLFKELRKQEAFGKVYEEIFGEPFSADVSVKRNDAPSSPGAPIAPSDTTLH